MIKIGNSNFDWGKKTYVMGVLNMTSDSFSGDGLKGNAELAIEQVLRMINEGADIIDIGGQATHPPGTVYGKGATEISAEEELKRVLPTLKQLKGRINIPISIDTYKSSVAERAIEYGATIINDVWGLKRDPHLAKIAAEKNVPIVLMHNQDTYEYTDIIGEIISSLKKTIELAIDLGVPEKHIIIDPGIGFGKTAEQNLEVLRHLQDIRMHVRYPMLLGSSRKSFIGKVLGDLPPQDRLEGTAATIALGIAQGIDIIRVHDVKEMSRVAKMSDAIIRE